MAKGLGAGYQPIAAVLASEKVISQMQAGSGTLWNGHTYMSHAIATAGALAVQQVIENDNLLANVQERGAQLETALISAFDTHENVGNIRGRGLFWSIEFVADRTTKKPFPLARAISPRLKTDMLARGIITYPSQGCIDGTNGDHMLLAPSYTSTVEEIELIVSELTQAVAHVLET